MLEFGSMQVKSVMMRKLLDEKRREVILMLSQQEYTQEDISYILRGADQSRISRILAEKRRNGNQNE